MAISVPLTPEEEARLIAIAGEQGTSPDGLVQSVVRQFINTAQRNSISTPGSEEREKHLAELFAVFDGANVTPGIREQTYHRENWYR